MHFLVPHVDGVKTAQEGPKVAKCVACAVFLQLFRRWARAFARPATRFNFFQARRQISQAAKNGKNRGLRSVFVGFSASCARLRTAGHWRELRREPATAQKTVKTVAYAVFSCSFQPFAHGCARQATGESSRDLPRRPTSRRMRGLHLFSMCVCGCLRWFDVPQRDVRRRDVT